MGHGDLFQHIQGFCTLAPLCLRCSCYNRARLSPGSRGAPVMQQLSQWLGMDPCWDKESSSFTSEGGKVPVMLLANHTERVMETAFS